MKLQNKQYIQDKTAKQMASLFHTNTSFSGHVPALIDFCLVM